MIAPETQRFMATRMKAQVRSHQVDHTPIVTAPALVVDLIREAARDAANSHAVPACRSVDRCASKKTTLAG